MLDQKDRIRTDYRSYKNGLYPIYIHLCKVCKNEIHLTSTQEKARDLSICTSCKNKEKGVLRKNNKILKKGVSKPTPKKKKMPQRKYFPKIGDIFGRLTLIEILAPDNIFNYTRYKCICTCGKECFVKVGRLYSGRTKSCSCYNNDRVREMGKLNALKEGNSTENSLIGTYKNAAKRRNLSFELNKEQAHKLFLGNCNYCGRNPFRTAQYENCINPFTFNGIDRVDNLLGYTVNNCVSCCTDCNRAKNSMDLEKFKNWIIMVYEHFI